MFRVVLTSLLCLACLTAQAEPSQQEIFNTQGRQRLVLLNQYLEVHARVNGRTALEFINTLEPSLPLAQEDEQALTFFIHKTNALRLVGQTQAAIELISKVQESAQQQHNSGLYQQALLIRSQLQQELANYDAAKTDAVTLLAQFDEQDPSAIHAEALLNMAGIDSQQNRFSASFKQLLAALSLYEHLNDKPHQATVNARIGSNYRSIGDLDNALAYLLKALDLQLQFGAPKETAETYNNTAIIFKDLGNYDKAIELHLKSLALKKSIGYERGMVYSMNNLGETYRLQGNLETATAYLADAESLARSLKNDLLLGSTLLYQGRIARQQGDNPLALALLTQAMDIYHKRHADSRLAEGLIELATLSELKGDRNTAISQLQDAINYARTAQKNLVMFDAYDRLSTLLDKAGQHAEAFTMLRTYLNERSRLLDLNSQQRIEMLMVANQVNEAKRSVQLVQQQAALTEANLQNQIAKRNQILFASMASLTLMFFFYSRHSQKKRLALEISTRKHIEQKEQQLSLALWGSGDVLWEWDLQTGKISHQNAGNLYDLPQNIPVADLNRFQQYIHPEDVHSVELGIKQLFEQQTDIFDVNYRIKLRSGDWLWVNDRGKVFERDEQNRPTRLAGTLHDIGLLKQHESTLISLNNNLESHVTARTHELQQALAELKSAQENLIKAEKMASLGRLVAGIAHEINTPVGTATTATSHVIEELGKIEALYKSGLLTEESLESGLEQLHEGQQLVDRSLVRTSRLIEQFKSLAIHSYAEQANDFSFQLMVNTALENAKIRADFSGPLVLCTSMDQTLHSYFEALTQVMTALLCNVCEHTGNNTTPEVHISLTESPDTYTIEVEDNGTGLPETEALKVFEPFYTTKRSRGHIGLGLNIAYNIISQIFNGDISYHPSRLGGAGFSIVIPKTG